MIRSSEVSDYTIVDFDVRGEFKAAAIIDVTWGDESDQILSSGEYWQEALRYRAAMLRHTEKYNSSGDIQAFEQSFRKLTAEAHRLAAFYGRVRAGGKRQRLDIDDELGDINAMNDLLNFGGKFIQDIQRARYGEPGEITAGMNGRAQQYLSKAFRATSAEGFIKQTPGNMEVYWNQTTLETGCSDCPLLEAGSPYRAITMTRFPGDGSTECRTNCQCVITREDGLMTFLPEPPPLGIYNA